MEVKRILLPHQYYYPNMNLLKNRSGEKIEGEFYQTLLQADSNQMATIYVHVPFCNSKCAFCGFDKEYDLAEMDAYVKKLLEEMHYYAELIGTKYTIQSIHFGGGTPALLPAHLLQKILDEIKISFQLSSEVSIDMEGSATTLPREDMIAFIKDNNLTRVSFGIQSFDARIREELQMKATLKDVFHTIDILKKNKIIMYADILYGYPQFFDESLYEILIKDIQTAINQGLDGVELGQMYPFKNQLEHIVKKRNLRLPSDAEIIEMIKVSTKMLKEASYKQTTYSGFTKQGKIILETSYYGGIDKMPDCIAMGSGAFGSLRGYKYRNGSYSVYMSQETPCYSQVKKLTQEQIENKEIVGFPKVLVLNKQLLDKPAVNRRFQEKFDTLMAEGYVREDEYAYYLTEKGTYYIDNLYWFLLEEEEKKSIREDMTIYVAE